MSWDAEKDHLFLNPAYPQVQEEVFSASPCINVMKSVVGMFFTKTSNSLKTIGNSYTSTTKECPIETAGFPLDTLRYGRGSQWILMKVNMVSFIKNNKWIIYSPEN